MIKSLGGTNILSFNKVFNSLSLCFVYLLLFYKPFKTFIIYFSCIESLYRNDPTPRNITYLYLYKYLESDLIKHCHVIFIHSLDQPLIVRSDSKVHRSRGNHKEIPTWASRVSNYSYMYFPWFNRQQTWRPATGSSL